MEIERKRWLYKREQSRGQREEAIEEREEKTPGDRRRLVCIRCGFDITTSDQRIEVSGLHAHTQVNPHGFVWRFGCFATAPGCIPLGPPSGEFTWFPGFLWQIEDCRGCNLHLGWRFTSDRESFHGLILDRLAESDAERPPE